ncbi:MAG: toxin-antitoxin system YwqK family antitoxin [Mucilaginibacter sp.]|uniref:toxin-antitoxin system YwqK family antitoxin n=1 Tax=Mucilaginibacter sp. TaxID=1882438 RepID=UPI0032641861
MAHREQYLNKIILLLLLVSMLPACKNSPVSMGRVVMSDIRLKQKLGFLYLKGVPFTGKTYELYDNGDTAKTICYKNGKEDGLTRWWHPNKQLAQERFFVNGWKQGLHKGWWPNGKIQFEYHFVNDEYEGEVREWFNNGKVSRVFHYAAGHEAGSQKMWWEDGKIRANYVIVNGEKFGLFGQKLCVNDIKG